MLATEQYRYIRRLLASHGQLVHDLQLHILGHTLFPEASAVDASGLTFQNLYIVCTDDLAVDVGQHPGQFGIRMLQHGIDPPYPVTTALGVVSRDNRFQDVSPVSWALFIIVI
ncbi:hypothetical protein D3C84_989950 [compost metagenome]